MSAVPNYAATPNLGTATIVTANVMRDGSGTLATVFTAGANGSMVSRLNIIARGNTTAGMIRYFIHNGTSAFLWKEVPVSAVTPSATTSTFNNSTPIVAPLYLPTGYSVRVSTEKAESFNIVIEGGDL